MKWPKAIGTPKQAKSTLNKLVKEEVDDKRATKPADRVAQQRAKKQQGQGR